MPDHKEEGGAAGGGDIRITADMLQQMLITAVEAGRAVQQPAVGGQAHARTGVDRKLIPQFWEARPAAWFRIFETHVPDEGTKRFDYLLSFLSTTALNQVDSIIDAPPQHPYRDAKAALLSHFQRNKYDKAGDLLQVTSLGDRTPSDLLRYMRSLQPGEAETSLFIVIFLNALPRNAKDEHCLLRPTWIKWQRQQMWCWRSRTPSQRYSKCNATTRTSWSRTDS